jgi:hypothetical protein
MTSHASTFAGLKAGPRVGRMAWIGLAMLALLIVALQAGAAGTGGTALQSAFTAVNDMVNGYGKQLMTVIAFGLALITWFSTGASRVILGFIGFAVFAGVGLAAATGLVGAVI